MFPLKRTKKKPTQTSTDEQLSWLGMVKFVWELLGNLRTKFLFFFLGLVFLQFYELVPPIVVGKIVDFFTHYEEGDNVDEIIYMIIFLGVTHFVIAMFRAPWRMNLRAQFTELVYRVKVGGFSRLIDFSLSWHEQENSGNKVQRLQIGTQALEGLGKTFSSGAGISVTLQRVVMVIIAFAFLNPIIVVFGIIYVSAFAFVHLTFTKKIKVLIDEKNKKLENASGSFYEGLTNILTIKSLGGKEAFTDRVSDAEAISRDYELKILRLRKNRVSFFHVVIATGLSSFLGILSWQFLRGDVTVGDILIYYAYLNRLIDNSWDLMDLFDEVQVMKQGLARMLPIFRPVEFATKGKEKLPNDWQKLVVKDGAFSYREGDKEFELKNINLELKRGEIIGIAGKSGSGKSTLVRLLLGLYKLKHGEYKIDDQDFYDLSHEEVTKHMAIVLQESELFNMSLQENITLLTKLDSDRLAKAINVAQLASVVGKLPQGLASLIGEKGYRVSGGERQRLGIARALYKDADILIFDEATSNLDTKTEAALQNALETELPGKTMIIIAHRLSTLKNVDRIYLFEQGEIQETGKFAELINNPESKFSELYNQQLRKQQ